MGLRDKRTHALTAGPHLPCTAAARGFVGLLGNEPDAFPEVRRGSQIINQIELYWGYLLHDTVSWWVHRLALRLWQVCPAAISVFSKGLNCCVGTCVVTPALVQVYCMTFELLDHEWLDMRASYMDFPAVLSRVRSRLEAALTAHPLSLQALRQLLL